MGLSGQNLFGHDIGGFLGAPSPELFIRWMDAASFTPLFRNHAINTSPPREPWSFGEPYTTHARDIINERYRLLPYLYTLFEESSRTGQPVLAPLFFHFPGDSQTYSQDTEFMVGPWLLVAPVVTEATFARSVYLPAGSTWRDMRTGAVFLGGQSVTTAAPLGKIPVFVREGAIIPRGPVMQYVGEPVVPSLTVDIYPGPDNTFSLYEDDGKSFDYTAGVFLRTDLARTTLAEGPQFRIARTSGTWLPPARNWTLNFQAEAAQPAEVSLNGAALPLVATEADLDLAGNAWFYRASDQLVIVRLQDSTAPLQVQIRR
jgi:alpha-glucosidase